MRNTTLILGCLLACAPSRAAAQSADVLFGGWSWRSREPGSRPAGLSGAYVAIADGVRTVQSNPAGLALVPHIEVSSGTGARWAGVARRFAPDAAEPEGQRPTQPGTPLPCPDPPRARPFAAAVYAEQAETSASALDVVLAPGVGARGSLESTREEVGAGVAKGITRWLDAGAAVAIRHLRMDGSEVTTDALGRELQRITVGGDSNKARVTAGLLASFGPTWSPTAFRLGVAYQRDVVGWSVDRTVIDRARGVVAEGPARLDIVEPPILSAGLAWRASDRWLLAGQLDYVWYEDVVRATEDAAKGEAFEIAARLEPRAAIEMTGASPTGGYYKIRFGVRRETSGRLTYLGEDPVLRQAYRGGPAAFRASGGVSLLAEFYERAIRFDLDLSQVVIERRSSLSAAGTRRVSFALTARL